MFGEGPAAPDAANRLGLTDWADEALLRLEHWRHRRAVIIACSTLALIALGAGWAFGSTTAGSPVESRIPYATSTAAGGVATSVTVESIAGGSPPGAPNISTPDPAGPVVEQFVVHVVGEIKRPGLVVVAADARVNDAVMAAGGPTPDADLQRLNLASPVVDGMQVRVPMVGAEVTGPLLSHPVNGTVGGVADRSGPVNLNTAPVDLLETLPGVGPATAAAIVTWREGNGGFQATDELLDVPGIGPAKLAAIRDLVEV